MAELILPQEILQLQGIIPCHPVQTNTRHLPVILLRHASKHPKRQPASHPRNPYNSSQDISKTSRPRTVPRQLVPGQYRVTSSPGHSPKTTRSRNTGQDSLLRQLVPGQHRAGLSKIICLKTYQQDIWCFRTIGPKTGIVTQLVPRHINKIYGVPRQQDNQSQDRNHYIQNSTRIHFKKGQVLYIHAILRSVCSNLLIRRVPILSRILVISMRRY